MGHLYSGLVPVALSIITFSPNCQGKRGSVSQFWRIPESCYAFRYLYGPGGWFVISKFQRMLNRVRKTRLPLTFQLSMRRLAQIDRNGEERENKMEGVFTQVTKDWVTHRTLTSSDMPIVSI